MTWEINRSVHKDANRVADSLLVAGEVAMCVLLASHHLNDDGRYGMSRSMLYLVPYRALDLYIAKF
jgi:hypothetical protein